jgi:GNAT superfamily N-acetyltransferase
MRFAKNRFFCNLRESAETRRAQSTQRKESVNFAGSFPSCPLCDAFCDKKRISHIIKDMMTFPQIRLATREDLPRLAEIETRAADIFPADDLPPGEMETVPMEKLVASMADSMLWVAEVGNAGVVGFVMAQIMGDCFHVAEIDVHPEHGRKGIGSALLKHACTVASQRGFRYATLTTFEHIPWNAPFYARRGFERIENCQEFNFLAGILEAEMQAGLKNRIAMRKRLAE